MLYSYDERIKRAKGLIQQAAHIVVGAGAGLSTAAGLEYSGRRFTDNFQPFIQKYKLEDLYSSAFYPFKTEEERWAYWARHISMNRYEMGATQLYVDLLTLLRNKEYFVVTTNVDGQFRKAGFDTSRLFEVQGDYAYFQCRYGCHNTLYYNEDAVKKMLAETVDCTIPSHLVPQCPICGREMDVNLRKDHYFVQDSSWHDASMRYKAFLSKAQKKSVVFIEIGVGFNTPMIIKYPFEEMVYNNPNATLIRMNKDFPESICENREKTISFDEALVEVIHHL